MKRLTAYGNKDNSLQAVVYRDADTGEFIVKFYRDGRHQTEADYHTDDLEDADGTAQHFVDNEPAPVSKALTNAEFCALVGPLVKADVHFELRLPTTHNVAWLTWNGGDAVHARLADGNTSRISLAERCTPAGLAALETVLAMEAAV